MKPAPFHYRRPASVREALELLAATPEAKLLAGGQSLLPLLNLRLATPPLIVDVGRIGGALEAVRRDGDELVIGAAVRTARLERDPLVREHAPLLAAAASHVGHPAIRNRGTLGGTVAHADPAAELPAALRALDARIVVAGLAGERRVAADDFFLGPLTPALGSAEMVTALRIPVARPGDRFGFAELARRSGDYAYAGAAVRLALAGGRLRRVRIALLAAGPTPLLARGAMGVLEGQTPSAGRLDEAAGAAARDCHPAGDLHASAEYRREAVRLATRRALDEALPEHAGGAP